MLDLCRKIERHYDCIELNVPIYSKRKRIIAEIDILARRDNTYDIFEVKCSHRIVKARKQLNKIRKVWAKRADIGKCFFFCGITGRLFSI